MPVPLSERVRLARVMAQRGLCSRREAERLITHGLVEVNGVVVKTLAEPVDPAAEIRIIGQGRLWLETKLTVLLHKPAGIVSTMPEGAQIPAWTLLTQDRMFPDPTVDPRNIERVLAKPWLLSVAGRLDKDSRGLLVMTTDGLLAKQITGGATTTKHYLVTVDRPVTKAQLERLRGPRQLDNKPLLAMGIDGQPGSDRLGFTLREGRKHQIRRVCLEEGLTVIDLLRDQIGPWALAGLPEGQWRLLTQASFSAPLTHAPGTHAPGTKAADGQQPGKPAAKNRSAPVMVKNDRQGKSLGFRKMTKPEKPAGPKAGPKPGPKPGLRDD